MAYAHFACKVHTALHRAQILGLSLWHAPLSLLRDAQGYSSHSCHRGCDGPPVPKPHAVGKFKHGPAVTLFNANLLYCWDVLSLFKGRHFYFCPVLDQSCPLLISRFHAFLFWQRLSSVNKHAVLSFTVFALAHHLVRCDHDIVCTTFFFCLFTISHCPGMCGFNLFSPFPPPTNTTMLS